MSEKLLPRTDPADWDEDVRVAMTAVTAEMEAAFGYAAYHYADTPSPQLLVDDDTNLDYEQPEHELCPACGMEHVHWCPECPATDDRDAEHAHALEHEPWPCPVRPAGATGARSFSEARLFARRALRRGVSYAEYVRSIPGDDVKPDAVVES